MSEKMLKVAMRNERNGLAEPLHADPSGGLITSDRAGIIKEGVDIVIPANGSVRIAESNELIFYGATELELGIYSLNEFEHYVRVDHYVSDHVNLRVSADSENIFSQEIRKSGQAKFSPKGNRVRITIFNTSDEEQLLSSFYLKNIKGGTTKANSGSSGIEGAYDNSSKTVRTLIQNSVEVEQPDAFQMSEVLLNKERVNNESSLFFSRIPPRGAKGFIATIHIEGVNASFDDNKGVGLRVSGRVADTTLTSFYVTTDRINSMNQKSNIFWFLNSTVDGLVQNENYHSKAVSLPLPKYLTFIIEKNEFGVDEYVDITLELGWLI